MLKLLGSASRRLSPGQGGRPMKYSNGKLLDVQHVTVVIPHRRHPRTAPAWWQSTMSRFRWTASSRRSSPWLGKAAAVRPPLHVCCCATSTRRRERSCSRAETWPRSAIADECQRLYEESPAGIPESLRDLQPAAHVEEYLYDTAVNFGMARNRRDATPSRRRGAAPGRLVARQRSASVIRMSSRAARSSAFRWRGRSSRSPA